MAIEVSVWRIDEGAKSVSLSGMDLEKELQDILVRDISLIDERLIVIGEKVRTDLGKEIDILGIDSEGNLVVIELKRDRTPRTVVAQILEYASWVYSLKADGIQQIFADFQAQRPDVATPLGINDALRRKFQSSPLEWNTSHRLMIVASEINPAIEQVVEYLDKVYGLNIEVALFRVFQDSERLYFARAWIGQGNSHSEEIRSQARIQGGWNGEWYVVFSGAEHRKWSDAVRYGFYSAGGGKPYAEAIKRLKPGDRIWVYVSGHGYVGVGNVRTGPTNQNEFTVNYQGQDATILDLLDLDSWFLESEENAEYFVGVDWVKTVDLTTGVREPGFFTNPNTVARPRDPKWESAVEFLKQAWGVE